MSVYPGSFPEVPQPTMLDYMVPGLYGRKMDRYEQDRAAHERALCAWHGEQFDAVVERLFGPEARGE